MPDYLLVEMQRQRLEETERTARASGRGPSGCATVRKAQSVAARVMTRARACAALGREMTMSKGADVMIGFRNSRSGREVAMTAARTTSSGMGSERTDRGRQFGRRLVEVFGEIGAAIEAQPGASAERRSKPVPKPNEQRRKEFEMRSIAQSKRVAALVGAPALALERRRWPSARWEGAPTAGGSRRSCTAAASPSQARPR